MVSLFRRSVPLSLVSLFAFCFFSARPAQAVILYGDVERNLSAPTGDLANSGWQYQGQWGSFLGTAIAPNYFITAAHIGGGIGQEFVYQGASYKTTGVTSVPNTDLNIWRIEGNFSSFAPLYSSDNETGRDLVVFGRGTARGGEVEISGQRKGWFWGVQDGAQSWGQNQVTAVVDGGTTYGELLAYTFDQTGGPNEGHLSAGDSGGGVFINDNGTWKLAGINLGVTGPYRRDPNSPDFDAAIYDQRGLYVKEGSGYRLVDPNALNPQPGASFSTRISSNMAFINFVIVPEPGTLALFAPGLVAALGYGARRRRRRVNGAGTSR